MMTLLNCDTCKHDLGGGCCRINLEAECREGGGFEAWEPREPDYSMVCYEDELALFLIADYANDLIDQLEAKGREGIE